ncbi:MAG TPA: branched-chain amino acid ABC transporter ATP-binding protein/permease [Candidatus Methylomirabilis sp.]|nr:branched-chain amino acid ABC transporter ATP-binding protein/permease [Candidatus Methylomirabilis sp.]
MAYAQAIFTNSAIYIIAAMGLAIFTGYTGLFSLGHAAFMAAGAYTAAILTYFYHWPIVAALLMGVIVSVLVSLVVGYPTLRAKLRSDYFAIATLGFGEALKVILENLDITQGARGLPGIQKLAGPFNTFVCMGLTLWLCRNFLRSTYGRKVIAIGQDPVAAEMIGIRLLPNQMLSLGISAGLAGLSGGLLAHYITFIQPAIFSMDLSSLLTAGVVCGGMGSLTGPFVATALFVVVPELFRGLALWRLVLYGVLLVVIMNLRPKGLFGHEELSLGNLPKLFIIIGLTMGLTIGAGLYRDYLPEWGEIVAWLLAAVVALGVTVAIGYAGGGLARLLRPVLPRWGAAWDRGFRRLVHLLDGLLAPRGRMARATGATEPRPQAGASASDEPLLSIRRLNKRFGGVVAVDSVDLDVWPGQIVGLIGPNGSGKTTLFNLTSGVYPIDSGSVRFEGRELAGQAPTSIVLGGISRTFQNIRLFSSMTVLENVQTALHTASDYGLIAAFVRWPWTVWATEERLRDRAMELLGVVELAAYADRVAGTLPYGLQRKLEVARALALQPRLLLLDEPAAGMNPQESLELVELIKQVHARRQLTIILIEHHMDVVMNLCERIAVLNFGKKIAEGPPDEIQANPLVLEAYLGQKAAYAALG